MTHANLHQAYTLQDIPDDAQVVRCPDCGQMEIWGIDEMTDHGACRSRGGQCTECGQSVGQPADADPKEYTLPSLRCLRCGHTWTPRTSQRPGVCPKCKHRRWDEPKRQ